jgi:primosomal protein N'
MKIIKYLSTHRNDFSAMLECEHCGHMGKLTSGYDDWNYHNRVIPSIVCAWCGLNRNGATEPLPGVCLGAPV